LRATVTVRRRAALTRTGDPNGLEGVVVEAERERTRFLGGEEIRESPPAIVPSEAKSCTQTAKDDPRGPQLYTLTRPNPAKQGPPQGPPQGRGRKDEG
jgi:hypothetical protein